jgi:hypothetical protein
MSSSRCITGSFHFPHTQEVRMVYGQTGINLEDRVAEERMMILTIATWRSFGRDVSYERCWDNAEEKFQQTFRHLRFEDACSVCDRLWCETQLKCVGAQHHQPLRRHFPGDPVDRFQVCSNCYDKLSSGRIPQMSRSNGFR